MTMLPGEQAMSHPEALSCLRMGIRPRREDDGRVTWPSTEKVDCVSARENLRLENVSRVSSCN
jgi:hypothetical protein